MNIKTSEYSVSYAMLRYFTPSLDSASPALKKASVRARKNRMSQLITYLALLEQQQRNVTLQGLSEATAANRASALRSFLRANHLQVDDVVGDELRLNFPKSVERFIKAMQDEGRSQRNITNSCSALRPWKKMVVEFDTMQALLDGKATPFMQAIQSVIADLPVARVAKSAGVPKDMLWGWLRGKVPRSSNIKYILRLESFFGVERNSLINLSGIKSNGPRDNVGGEPFLPKYNQQIGSLTKFHYRLKPEHDSPLREQWAMFLRYKTSAVPKLKRMKRGKWRFSPCPLTPTTDNNWWCFLDGQEVASARMAWNRVSSFLGWLSLPCENGGHDIPQTSLQTLAWLAIPDFIEDYLDWHKTRIGKRNQGFNQFLALIASLVRPEYGYLYQHPELLETLPKSQQVDDWASLCKRQFELTDQLATAYQNEIEITRDPFEPMKKIIELPQPMVAIADMIQRLRADRPVGTPMREAIWSRDLVLLKILVSNPLRRRNIAHLTWRADNTGDLYQRDDKSWWIRVARIKFKNSYGAAGKNIYDCQVNQSAWSDIERYLFIHRPLLLRNPTDLLFLCQSYGQSNEHLPWKDVSTRVREITSKYLPRCAGIGIHAFRHLVATSILKAEGGDFKTAAGILNDRVATVEKHYSGFFSNDAAARMSKLLESEFARM